MGSTESMANLIAQSRLEDLQQILSQPGLDVNSGFTNPPLIQAIACRNVGAVKLLLNVPELDVNRDGGPPLFRQGPLHLAVHNCDYDIAELLLTHPNIDVNKGYYCTPLMRAIEKGDLHMMQLLLAHPLIDVNRTFGESPLTKCLSYRNNAALKLLISHPTIQLKDLSSQLLFYAIDTCDIELLSMLVQHPQIELNALALDAANSQCQACTPLSKALQRYIAALEGRREPGAHFWEPDFGEEEEVPYPSRNAERSVSELQPAAHTAKIYQSKRKTYFMMVQLLASSPSCDVSKGDDSSSPLHLCSQHGLTDVAALLMKYHPEADHN